MGYNNNQFPVFLSMKTDGTLEATLRNFEEFAIGSMGRVAKTATAAGTVAGTSFDFSKSIAQLREVEATNARVQASLAKSRTDPLGITSALGKSGGADVLGYLPAQLAAEKKLGEERLRTVDLVNKAEMQLDEQRQAALRNQMSGTARAFEQVMRGIAAQQSAIANARGEVAGIAGRRSVDSTLASRGVGGYGNGDGAARASAAVFEEAAKANDAFVLSLNRGFGAIGRAMSGLQALATEERNAAAAADLLAAINLRTGASLTGLGTSARESASVFTAAFAEQERAAQAASAGIARAFQQIEVAARAQVAEEKRGLEELYALRNKLVAGREFIQAPGFNPQQATAAAAAARSHAAALDQVARAAEQVVLQSGRATATDAAFAHSMREAAQAATLEANRLDDLAATQGRVAAAAGKLSGGSLELATSVRGTRQATLQASQQFQDFFIQIQGGQNPMVAFTQQASQLAFVMANTGGKAGKLASFIAGGWGTAFFIGLAALTPFVSKLFEGEKATKKATEAKELHKKTLEQLIEAINTETEALGKSNQSSRDSERASLLAALAKEGEAKSRLENAQAMLKEAAAQARIGEIAGAGSETAAAIAVDQDKKVAALQGEIDSLLKALGTTRVGIGRSLVPIANRRDEERRDPRAKITGDYERALTAARRTMDDEIAKGADVNQARVGYSKALDVARNLQTKANKALDAKEEADRKAAAAVTRGATRAEREAERTDSFAKFDLPFARSTVTSGFGRRASPGGIGSTNHQAVDFAPGAGATVRNPGTAGIVIHAGRLGGYGNAVIVDHGGGTITQYSHLASVLVSKNQKVGYKDELGTVGSTGRSTGAHLDYKVKTGGKFVDPLKVSNFRVDESKVELAAIRAGEAASRASEQAANAASRAAEKAQNEQSRLAAVAQTASDRVAGITSQFDRQPRLIDQAGKAMRSLDDVTRDAVKAATDYGVLIDKLKTDKPAGFEDQVATLEAAKDALGTIVADANAARVVVAEGLVRPFEDMVLEAAKQAEIDALILAGKEDQADVMREIVALEEQMGPLTENQRLAVEKTVTAQRMMKRALEENEKVIGRAVQSANVLQDALTGVIADPFNPKAWKSGLQSLMADFKDAFAANLSKSLFGNLGQEMEDAMRMKADPLGAAGEELNTSALELHRSAIELMKAAGEISKNAAGRPSPEQVGITPSAYLGVDPAGGFGAALGGLSSAFGGGAGSMLDLLGKVSTAVGGQAQAANENVSVSVSAEDLAKRQLDLQKKSALMSDPTTYYNMLGSSVGKSMDKVFGSGELFSKIGSKLGTALQGASIGQSVGELPGMLGLKTSKLGSQLGGAVGSLIGGPIGAILGGLAGSILGGLFKKTKKAVATIGADAFGNLDVDRVGGNSKKRETASTKAADSVIDALYQLANQFGTSLNAAAGGVSLGMRGKDYVVDPSGSGRTKGKDIVNFGEDAEAAMEFAIRNLIEDGVLDGIRAGTKKLLVEGRLLSRSIEKALKFENVFKRLKEFDDPVGAAIDALDREFQELRRIFAEAGASAAELTDLERLYAIERSEAIKSAAKDATSTLKQLFEDLTFKGDFGLSLRTRRTNAESALAPFQQQIASGQAVDQEGFSEAARALLDVERQLYGSTSQYFETLNMITQLTRMAINAAGGSVSVPGITPQLVRSTATSPATLTSPTPGVSTAAPGGQAAVPGSVQQAANENYSMGLMIVAAIEKQTSVIAPLISQPSIASAIKMAFVSMTQGQSGAGGYGGSSAPAARTASWASELIESNGQVVNKLGELVGFASDTAEATAQFVRTSGDGLPANHWSKGQMSSPNIYTGTYGGGPGRTASFASEEPANRLSTSVSGF